jgi:NAD(P)-dependent dehydrogenase (short-subunit alcohol dehydrogenase family)
MVGIPERLFVITGAAKGIGEVIARRLEVERARAIITDVDEELERKRKAHTVRSFFYAHNSRSQSLIEKRL